MCLKAGRKSIGIVVGPPKWRDGAVLGLTKRASGPKAEGARKVLVLPNAEKVACGVRAVEHRWDRDAEDGPESGFYGRWGTGR